MQCISPYLKKDKFGNVQALPCGHCVTCKIQRRREWTIRLLNELDYWRDAVFLTLTYDDEHLGENSLDKKDLQNYLKNTRKEFNHPIRYYACGEYGEQRKRKHFHLIIFGVRPNDSRLKKHWNKGFICTGTVTHDSIQYVAGYVQKKLYGKYAPYEELGISPPFRYSRKVLAKGIARITRSKFFENLKLDTKVRVMVFLDTIVRFLELIIIPFSRFCGLKKKGRRKNLTDWQS